MGTKDVRSTYLQVDTRVRGVTIIGVGLTFNQYELVKLPSTLHRLIVEGINKC